MAQDPQRLNSKNSVLLLTKLVEYLEAQGVGTQAVDLFLQVLPDKPVTGTVVVHSGGIELPEDPTRRPSFTVIHRNQSVEAGLAKTVQIHRLLSNQWNVLSGFPGRITSVSEAGAYFKDDAGLIVFPLNFVLVSTYQR